MTRACRYHCAACGRHFTSLEAFDLHRTGDYESARACADPEAIPRPDGSPALAPVEGARRLGGSPRAAAGAAAFRAARSAGLGRDECCAAAERAEAAAAVPVDEPVVLWESTRPGRAEVAERVRATRHEAIR